MIVAGTDYQSHITPYNDTAIKLHIAQIKSQGSAIPHYDSKLLSSEESISEGSSGLIQGALPLHSTVTNLVDLLETLRMLCPVSEAAIVLGK